MAARRKVVCARVGSRHANMCTEGLRRALGKAARRALPADPDVPPAPLKYAFHSRSLNVVSENQKQKHDAVIARAGCDRRTLTVKSSSDVKVVVFILVKYSIVLLYKPPASPASTTTV